MRLRKYLLRGVVIHIAVSLLAACSSKKDAAPPDSTFRVALLTPGPISDQAWNAAAYQGLERIRDSLGAEISHIQTRTPAEFEENFRQYGAKGYAVVIGHGFEFQDAAQRVGPEYPKTVFVTTGGTGTGPNIAALSFAFDEPSYLAGMAAAAVSKSGVIATIGGTELPPVRASFRAFEEGARLIRPDITVLGAYIGNWDDAGAGKEQALAHIARRADVIFQNADAAGLGVFQAVRESRGTWIIGSNADQNGVAPEVTLGSVLVDVPHAFLLLAKEVKAGTFAPRVVRFDMASDAVRWIPNPAISPVPAPILARIDTVRGRLVRHEFTLPPVAEP
jgi:basic membrane lipoprotein Med (substrate-binding protein (PBP1-ABC) superfamily)